MMMAQNQEKQNPESKSSSLWEEDNLTELKNSTQIQIQNGV